jgi:hypothetical protein
LQDSLETKKENELKGFQTLHHSQFRGIRKFSSIVTASVRREDRTNSRRKGSILKLAFRQYRLLELSFNGGYGWPDTGEWWKSGRVEPNRISKQNVSPKSRGTGGGRRVKLKSVYIARKIPTLSACLTIDIQCINLDQPSYFDSQEVSRAKLYFRK